MVVLIGCYGILGVCKDELEFLGFNVWAMWR